MSNRIGQIVCFLLVFAETSLARHPASSRDCNQPAAEAVTFFDLPGHPFSAIPSRDGCWVYVSVSRGVENTVSGIAVLRRGGGKVAQAQFVPTERRPFGMVMTHKADLLIAAATDRLLFFDPHRLVAGQAGAMVGEMNIHKGPMHIYVNVTRDDKFLFVSEEALGTITVIDLARARKNGFKPDAVVGQIPVGVAPIALSFSPDERYLYTTSQAVPKSGWPAECTLEGKDAAETKPVRPQGAVHVVDVARAKVNPAHSVIATVPAGCSTVRLDLSPAGDVVYATARNSNALLAFNTRKLLSDTAHARIGTVPVGVAPVGVAVIEKGRKVVVANSNRFAGGASDLTVVDAARVSSGAAAVLGTVPAGAFPREFSLTADGRALLVSNYMSRNLQLIDLARLPLRPAAK